MAQVPYTGVPQVAPEFHPTQSISQQTDASMFGGATAEATGQLGRAIGSVGNELFARANAMQQLDQSAEAANAVANFTDKLGARDVEYRSLEGKAAKDGYQPYVDDVNKIREEAGKTLSSPYAQRLFLQESRSIQSRAVIGAGIHAGEQFKHYLGGTEQARTDSAQRATANNPTSDEEFKASLSTIDSSANMMQSIHGWSKEKRDDFATTNKSQAVYGRATALARTDPVAAQKVLNDSIKAGYISSEDAGKASQFIRAQRNNVTARVESASMLSGEGLHFGDKVVSVDRAREAIAGIESGGNYNPSHPDVTHTVNGQRITEHALGRYGIMESNLAPWLKEAGMPSMSEAAFLSDHAAQDKLFAFKFGQLMDKNGSANKAAAEWFTGSPNPDPSSNDGHTTAPKYLQKFNAGLARSVSSGELDEISQTHADKVIPNDTEFQLHFRDHVQAEHRRDEQIRRETEFNQYNSVSQAILTPDQDGKLITSIDQLHDPKLQDAWNQLSGGKKEKLRDALVSNAQNEYADTPQSRQAYQQWIGRMKTVSSAEDMKEILSAEFLSLHMPAPQKLGLFKEQAKLFKSTQADPNVTHALGIVERTLGDAMPKKKTSDYWNLAGAMDEILQERIQSTGKKPDEEEIKTIGARLVREQVTSPGWLWDSRGPAYQTDVPEAEKTKIVSSYTQLKGVPPSDQQIHNIYIANQYNQLYTKPKATP